MAGATTMDPSQSPPNVGDAVEENVPWDKHESGMYRANVDIDHAEGAAEDAAMAGQEARDDLLLCEGYLKKIRGWGQNRTRWFRLTTNEFSFYSKDAGDLLAQCPHDNIASVSSKEGTRFEVETKTPFGRTENCTMLLEAPSMPVKEKWLKMFARSKNAPAGLDSSLSVLDHSMDAQVDETEELLIEGHMTKLQQSLTAMSRTRWFVFTNRFFSYYDEEGGKLIAHCPIAQLKQICPTTKTAFEVVAHEPFTKSGASRVELQCRNPEERDKWLSIMQATIPDVVKTIQFTPLSTSVRSQSDHYGVVVSGEQSAVYLAQQARDIDHSQGNRFIHDDHL